MPAVSRRTETLAEEASSISNRKHRRVKYLIDYLQVETGTHRMAASNQEHAYCRGGGRCSPKAL